MLGFVGVFLKTVNETSLQTENHDTPVIQLSPLDGAVL